MSSGDDHHGRGADRTSIDRVDAVWHTHRRWVAAIVLAHKPADADLDDLLQEVAMRLVGHIQDIRDVDAIRPWLRTVAINVAREAARRRRPQVPMADDSPVAAKIGPDVAVIAEGDALLRRVMSLPIEYREPMLLRGVRGLSHREIAQVMGLTVRAVESRLVRARRMLREEMESRERPKDHHHVRLVD